MSLDDLMLHWNMGRVCQAKGDQYAVSHDTYTKMKEAADHYLANGELKINDLGELERIHKPDAF